MKQYQAHNSNCAIKGDLLCWRVMNAKKRYSQKLTNRAYSSRPRLRSEAHH